MQPTREQANQAWQSSNPEYCWHENAQCGAIIDSHSIPKSWLSKIAVMGTVTTPVPHNPHLRSLYDLDPNDWAWNPNVRRASTGRWSCGRHDTKFNDELMVSNPVPDHQADSAAIRAIIHAEWVHTRALEQATHLAYQGDDYVVPAIQALYVGLRIVQSHGKRIVQRFKNSETTGLTHTTHHIPGKPKIAGSGFTPMADRQGFATLSVCPISTGHIVLFSASPYRRNTIIPQSWLSYQIRKYGVATYTSLQIIAASGPNFYFSPGLWETIEKPYWDTAFAFYNSPISTYSKLPVPNLFTI